MNRADELYYAMQEREWQRKEREYERMINKCWIITYVGILIVPVLVVLDYFLG
jgi:hypothetical protein